MNMRYCWPLLLLVTMSLGVRPQDAVAVKLNRLAAVMVANGDHENAVSILEQAVSLAPQFAVAHYNLGTAFFH